MGRIRKKLKRTDDDEGIQGRVDAFEDFKVSEFAALPLSKATLTGLDKSHFQKLTEIQRRGIPLGLKGRDILGAARTGSGKTLAFLVPILEHLYRQQWTQLDGLGALIISPTRELAIQIFDVLRSIGRNHTFSAGLVIGGKSLEEEQERLSRMNILVCTPGRLLQHMDQTAGFEAPNLQILVLDEADRILDMGFKDTLDAIIEHLPPTRQTLLYSATQTKKISDLARLSLKEPEYVAVHAKEASATPITLSQYYTVVSLQEKLNTLYGFIKTHLNSRILVFMSSGKQVRFVFETFCQLRPGIPLMHLLGKQKQTARVSVMEKYAHVKNGVLFATDIAARGLDFPAVDWVIQLDAPEDADTYIHRVGRTARYERNGKALLLLLPNEEEGMIKRLGEKKVSVERINVREKKKTNVQSQLQAFCFQDPEIKYLAQKAFISYVRSIDLQKDKQIFDVKTIPFEEFAKSLGLQGPPHVKLQALRQARLLKNAPETGADISDQEEGDGKDIKNNGQVRTKYDRMFQRRNQNVLSDHYAKVINTANLPKEDNPDDEGEIFTVKRRNHDLDDDSGVDEQHLSRRKARQAVSKKASIKNAERGRKVWFDEEGEAHPADELEDDTKFQANDPLGEIERFVTDQRNEMRTVDVEDKLEAKERKREKKRRKLERQRQIENEMAMGESEGDDVQERAHPQRIIEFKQPETLEDLEALSSKLLQQS